MNIVIVGLSITSSWGNGHPTTYRALVKALRERGHGILFLECRQKWYEENADLPAPAFCQLGLYSGPADLQARFTRAVAEADVVLIGSYVPQAIELAKWVFETAAGTVAFYDIDTPVTLAALANDRCTYLSRDLVPQFDLYLSFTGGPTLQRLEQEFGARQAEGFYCCVDPAEYFPEHREQRWVLGYLGTYSSDRQASLQERLVEPAQSLPWARFAIAGAQFPSHLHWPENVEHLGHLPPGEHRAFYNAQRYTLNATREEMVRLGWSPSVRLFEAAACGTPIITDAWDGLEDFFEPGEEIVVARNAKAVRSTLLDLSEAERLEICRKARARVLRDHTAAHRARQLEKLVSGEISSREEVAA